MLDIYSQTIEDLEKYFININENKAKAKIIYRALCGGIKEFEEIKELKETLRDKLSEDFYFDIPVCIDKIESEDVIKLLFLLSDGNMIEAVLMRQIYGNSICISTQIGCNMSCVFCESGKNKKVRNLTSGEIASQIYYIRNVLKEEISTITIMGIGEPFDNYDEVMKFVDIVTSPYGLAVGTSHITVSTCGIVPRIYEFSDRKYSNNLAVSLHAPNDELRCKLMSINKVYSIGELIKSIEYYIEKTNKKVLIEYIMIDNINDKVEYATQLRKLLKSLKCTVNLIPYNETDCNNYKRSSFENMMLFYKELRKNKIHVTMRREFGKDINGACGQLRSKYII